MLATDFRQDKKRYLIKGWIKVKEGPFKKGGLKRVLMANFTTLNGLAKIVLLCCQMITDSYLFEKKCKFYHKEIFCQERINFKTFFGVIYSHSSV